MSNTETEAGGSMSPRATTTYRCFLFADLRGYTSYIEHAGNAAGVALLDEYLAITRAAVAEHDGAEIKVEGDGFHAVFPSSSGAVMCGLAIVQGADDANRAHPERPMNVGVGVHAGEAVETADGYIGSAVNLASRLCAAASAGEVLVSGTVRGITQASIPVTFASRGRRRLKGIDEPVELFAAVPDGSRVAPARSWALTRWLAVAVVALVVAAAAVGIVALPGLVAPVPTASPPPPTPQSLAIGPLQLGSYLADQFHPSFGFVVDDPGWSVYRVYTDALGLRFEGQPPGRLDIGHIPLLYTNPCSTEGESVSTGTSVNDLEAALRSVPFLEVGETKAAEISGNYAISVDVTVSQAAQAACGGFGAEGISVFRVAEDTWQAMPTEVFRLRAVDVESTTVAFITTAESTPTTPVPALEQIFARADRIIDSVDF